MSNPSEESWSNNPNAPGIPYQWYAGEKAYFAGTLIGAMLYGITTVLFFQCMAALLNRTRRDIKWGFVAHTAAMFAFVTTAVAMTLDFQSISYIDCRGFSGGGFVSLPGPFGYQLFILSKAINGVPNIIFFLNQWLADGLLLYRCHVIFSMNYRVIAFPCLMYLASLASGTVFICEASKPGYIAYRDSAAKRGAVSYYSISLSLNVLLTFMITIRLVLHSRNIRNAMGPEYRASGLYKVVITVLIESCALYAISFLLFIGPWIANHSIQYIFWPILAETQVIAPFLIIPRVANRTAFTSNATAPGTVGSICFRSQEKSTNSSETFLGGSLVSSIETSGETSGGLGVGAEDSIDEVLVSQDLELSATTLNTY